MTDHPDVAQLHHPIPFTIDGQPFSTTDRRQPAAGLLRLAGLDPALFDLAELRGSRPETRRFADDEEVTIRKNARFVSIRQCADVA